LIVGIGVDLCDIQRLESLVERYGDRFVGRVFTEAEQARCHAHRRRAQCLAGRFAAKEATLKALGTGLSHGIAWRDVEVVTGESQAPRIELHRMARSIAQARGVERIHCSITHDGGMGAATVILEASDGP